MIDEKVLAEIEAALDAATDGTWCAWFRAPDSIEDSGGLDLSIETPDDDWVIAEFHGWGAWGTPEWFDNPDRERNLAIILRNNAAALLASARREKVLEGLLREMDQNVRIKGGWMSRDLHKRIAAALEQK